jgi:hypothetical protein
MRRMLFALVFVGIYCPSALGQQAIAPVATAPTVDSPSEATWITHRRAGQLQWLDPANWEIRGCRTYASDSIRAALAVDIDVTLATHPSAPADNLDTLPALLRDKIVIGYQSNGFLQPQVNVQHAQGAKKILIDIAEGARYACGAVEVTGMQQLSKERLVAELIQPQGGVSIGSLNGTPAASNTAIWKTGQPVGFSPVDMVALRKKVQQVCAELGRPAAKFDLKIVPNGATGRLLLNIVDEGPASTIDRVMVSGNEKNGTQQILDYLGIKPGAVWTRDERLRIEQRLSDAARFRKTTLEFTAAQSPAESTLSILLVESKSAPPLSQPFSPVEDALLKFGQWLSRFDQSEEDLVCTFAEGPTSVEATFSPHRGGVLTFRQQSDDKKTTAAPARSVVFSTDTLGLYSEVRGRQWVARPLPGFILSSFELRVAAQGEEEQTTLSWGVGARSTTSASAGSPSMQVSVTAAPVALVSFAHQEDAHCTLADHVLTVELSKTTDQVPTRVRIDATTGKLLDAIATNDDGGEGRLALVAGAYLQRTRNLEAAWSQKPNDFDPKLPLSSVIGFLLDEARSPDLEKLELAPPLAINAVRKTISQGLVEPFDQYLLQSAVKFAPPLFSIPYDYDSRPKFVSMLGKFAFVSWILGNDVTARDTWPWVLTRETTAWMTGLDEFQQLELAEQLELPGNGPLCCLATAELLVLAGQNDQARQFAMLGLAQLNPEDFHNDVAGLLDERGLLGRCLLRIAEVLRETDTLTVAFVGFVLPEGPQQLLTNFYIDLTKDRSRPIAQALPETLDRIWATSIKSNLETALKAVKEKAVSAPALLATPRVDGSKLAVPATARDVRRDETPVGKK